MKKLIIILSIVFFVLIITFTLISRRNAKISKQTIVPTSTIKRPETILPTLIVQEKQKEVARVNKQVMTIEQAERFQNTRTKLPIKTPDFEIAYFPLLNEYFILKKSARADQEINLFLQNNGLSDIRNNFPNLFITTTEPTEEAIKKAEDDFLKKTHRGPYALPSSQVKGAFSGEVKGTSDEDEFLNNLWKVNHTLQNDPNLTEGEEGAGGTNTPPPGGGPTGDTSSIDAIFNEVANKVGVPAALPKAVMQKECGSVLSLSSEEISQFSQPGQGITADHPTVGLCFDNHFDVGCCYGPMQFTEGTWQGYATAVNDLGGYSHNPYIENIRDSVYGAAKKLKSDGGGGDVASWTKEQFFQAFRSYYGACGDSYDPNYCEDAWQNYQNNQ